MPSTFRTAALLLALASAASVHASTDAYARATVLGRANGAAIACSAPKAKLEKFQAQAKAELQKLARDESDLSDATTRMTLDTVFARKAVEKGSISCADALWFYEDQAKSLQRSKK